MAVALAAPRTGTAAWLKIAVLLQDPRQHRGGDARGRHRCELPQHLDRGRDRARHGQDRLDGRQPAPREVNPRTGEIVWQYSDPSLFEFFSPYTSGAQRLPNGNTLICEGCHGRIFEVTCDGQVVWEYVSPHFAHEPGAPGLNNGVFRALRYTPAEIEAARRAG
jgi:hypothetical protein